VPDEISLKKVFLLSILLHLLLLLVPLRMVIKDTREALAEELQKEIDRMTFIFVETPEDAVESPVEQVTPFISDKNLAASNLEASAELAEGLPFQEGRSEIAAMMPEPTPFSTPVGVTDGSQEQAEDVPERQSEQPGAASFDAFRELKALSRLAPPKAEDKPLTQPQQPRGDESRPYAPTAPRFDSQRSRAPVSDFRLSTYNWNWAPYLKELKKRIESNLYPPPAFYMGLARGRTFVQFKIQQDGLMTDFKLITYTGHESLKDTSVNSIEASVPFLPLPSDFPEDFLEITVGFFYNEFIR